MREAIGSVALYNFIIAFIIVVFIIIADIINYYKAFKVNNIVMNSIEKFEGYNELSAEEIDIGLSNMGYLTVSPNKCPKKNGKEAMTNITGKYRYCVYEYQDSKREDYYSFGVITYMYVDIPIINTTINIPVYSKTDTYYRFHIEDLYK